MLEYSWVLIPLAGIFVGALAIWTEHKRKLAMIERGKDPEPERKRKRDDFQGGIVMMGIGAAFLITGFILWTELVGPFGLIGLICAFIGLALVLSHTTERKR